MSGSLEFAHSGWLSKRAGNGLLGFSTGKWHKYWFVLSNATLVYFESPSANAPRGKIRLHGAKITAIYDPKHPHHFEIRAVVEKGGSAAQMKTIQLTAPTEAALAEWLYRLKQQKDKGDVSGMEVDPGHLASRIKSLQKEFEDSVPLDFNRLSRSRTSTVGGSQPMFTGVSHGDAVAKKIPSEPSISHAPSSGDAHLGRAASRLALARAMLGEGRTARLSSASSDDTDAHTFRGSDASLVKPRVKKEVDLQASPSDPSEESLEAEMVPSPLSSSAEKAMFESPESKSSPEIIHKRFPRGGSGSKHRASSALDPDSVPELYIELERREMLHPYGSPCTDEQEREGEEGRGEDSAAEGIREDDDDDEMIDTPAQSAPSPAPAPLPQEVTQSPRDPAELLQGLHTPVITRSRKSRFSSTPDAFAPSEPVASGDRSARDTPVKTKESPSTPVPGAGAVAVENVDVQTHADASDGEDVIAVAAGEPLKKWDAAVRSDPILAASLVAVSREKEKEEEKGKHVDSARSSATSESEIELPPITDSDNVEDDEETGESTPHGGDSLLNISADSPDDDTVVHVATVQEPFKLPLGPMLSGRRLEPIAAAISLKPSPARVVSLPPAPSSLPSTSGNSSPSAGGDGRGSSRRVQFSLPEASTSASDVSVGNYGGVSSLSSDSQNSDSEFDDDTASAASSADSSHSDFAATAAGGAVVEAAVQLPPRNPSAAAAAVSAAEGSRLRKTNSPVHMRHPSPNLTGTNPLVAVPHVSPEKWQQDQERTHAQIDKLTAELENYKALTQALLAKVESLSARPPPAPASIPAPATPPEAVVHRESSVHAVSPMSASTSIHPSPPAIHKMTGATPPPPPYSVAASSTPPLSIDHARFEHSHMSSNESSALVEELLVLSRSPVEVLDAAPPPSVDLLSGATPPSYVPSVSGSGDSVSIAASFTEKPALSTPSMIDHTASPLETPGTVRDLDTPMQPEIRILTPVMPSARSATPTEGGDADAEERMDTFGALPGTQSIMEPAHVIAASLQEYEHMYDMDYAAAPADSPVRMSGGAKPLALTFSTASNTRESRESASPATQTMTSPLTTWLTDFSRRHESLLRTANVSVPHYTIGKPSAPSPPAPVPTAAAASRGLATSAPVSRSCQVSRGAGAMPEKHVLKSKLPAYSNKMPAANKGTYGVASAVRDPLSVPRKTTKPGAPSPHTATVSLLAAVDIAEAKASTLTTTEHTRRRTPSQYAR